jgi:hypothetical protein
MIARQGLVYSPETRASRRMQLQSLVSVSVKARRLFDESAHLPRTAPGVVAMVDPAAHTTQLVRWPDRMRAGQVSARDELIRGFQSRLELLARKMVGRHRRVIRWVDGEDVLQNALLRLLRTLETVQPDSASAFFGLAAEQMRRELLMVGNIARAPAPRCEE